MKNSRCKLWYIKICPSSSVHRIKLWLYIKNKSDNHLIMEIKLDKRVRNLFQVELLPFSTRAFSKLHFFSLQLNILNVWNLFKTMSETYVCCHKVSLLFCTPAFTWKWSYENSCLVVKTLDQGVSCLNPLDCSRVDSAFHPSEVRRITSRNFWELSDKK